MPKIEAKFYTGANLLKAIDLEGLKQEATIVSMRKEVLQETGETWLVKFKEYEKELPLNKTNMKALVERFSDEVDKITGNTVLLVKVLAPNPSKGGKETESIRIRFE